MDITLQQEQSVTPSRNIVFTTISVETLCYIVIFALAIGLRVISLGGVTLNDLEAHEALAALHRAEPDMTATPAIANYPLMAFFNQFAFFLLNASTPLARLSTAIVGALMVWGPYLWRRQLGLTAALATSLLLAISPVALAASRTMGGTWSGQCRLFLCLIWLIDRFFDSADRFYAILATIVFGMIAFLD